MATSSMRTPQAYHGKKRPRSDDGTAEEPASKVRIVFGQPSVPIMQNPANYSITHHDTRLSSLTLEQCHTKIRQLEAQLAEVKKQLIEESAKTIECTRDIMALEVDNLILSERSEVAEEELARLASKPQYREVENQANVGRQDRVEREKLKIVKRDGDRKLKEYRDKMEEEKQALRTELDAANAEVAFVDSLIVTADNEAERAEKALDVVIDKLAATNYAVAAAVREKQRLQTALDTNSTRLEKSEVENKSLKDEINRLQANKAEEENTRVGEADKHGFLRGIQRMLEKDKLLIASSHEVKPIKAEMAQMNELHQQRLNLP